MSHQLGSSPSLLYRCFSTRPCKTQTGILQANHPLAEKLQNCDSVAVTTVLREAFSEFRGKNKNLKLLNNISFLPEVSATAGLGLSHPTPSWESTAALLTGLALRMCHT